MIDLRGTSPASRAFRVATVRGASIVECHLGTPRALVINQRIARYNAGRDNKSLNRSSISGHLIDNGPGNVVVSSPG